MRQLVSYMKTWSAYKMSQNNSKAAVTLDKITRVAETLAPDGETIPIRMPLVVIAGYVRN